MQVAIEAIGDRFREATATLLSIPGKASLPAGMASRWPDEVHEIISLYSARILQMRPPLPEPVDILMMDEVWRWLTFLPLRGAGVMRRKVLLMCSMQSPVTGRRIFSSAAVGRALRVSSHTVQREYALGLEAIRAALENEPDPDDDLADEQASAGEDVAVSRSVRSVTEERAASSPTFNETADR